MQCPNCFKEIENTIVCPHCGYDSKSDEGKYPLALKPGTILNGKYIVGRVLGQGGFGVTYIAQDYETKDRVAIKEYMPEEFATRTTGTYAVSVYSGDKQENFEFGKEKFLGEARTLAEFSGNKSICAVYRYFEENGTAYLVMEYIDGIGLDKYVKDKGGKLSIEETKKFLLPIMDALSLVHSKGIVHRDIAPDNIMITKDGTAKLIDFGAARYSIGEKTRSLDVILKHGFAPVEQYSRHGKQGSFTDVYALGATFYYLLTGKLPPDSIDRMGNDNIADPSALGAKLSIEEEDAIMKALSVDASGRFHTMAEFKDAFVGDTPVTSIEVGCQPEQIAAKQTTEPNPVTQAQPKKVRPLFMGIAAVTLLAVVAIVAFSAGNKKAEVGEYINDESSTSVSLSSGNYDIWNNMPYYDDQMVTYDTKTITDKLQTELYNDGDIVVSLMSLEKNGEYYTANMLIDNRLSSENATCFLHHGYIDDYKIDLYSPFGYRWIASGKKGNTYSQIQCSDLKNYGITSFSKLYADLCVVTTDGISEQYIAKIPLEIDGILFE